MAVAVGGAVLAAFGGVAAGAGAAAAVGAAFTFSATMAGLVGGAIIGAAIGGLTALVTGGDLGKGILYGAIGGAVAGGISGYLGGATSASSSFTASGGEQVMTVGGSDAAQLAAAEAATTQGVSAAGGGVVEVGSSGGLGSFSFGAEEIGNSITSKFGGSAVEGVIGLLGKGMEGSAMEEMAEKEAQWQREENALQREHQLKLAEMNSSGGGGSSGSEAAMYSADKNFEAAMAKIAEERRQFNEQMRLTEEDRANRKKSLRGFKVVNRPTGKPNDPSILTQVSEDVQENLPMNQTSGTPSTPEQGSALNQYAPQGEEEAAYG